MRFKKQRRKEIFLGSLRATVDEETKSFLSVHLPISRRIIDGHIFVKFADGHVEYQGTVYDGLLGKIKEMKERER